MAFKDGIDTALPQFLGSIWDEGIACFGHDLLSSNVPNWADFAVKLDYAQSLSEDTKWIRQFGLKWSKDSKDAFQHQRNKTIRAHNLYRANGLLYGLSWQSAWELRFAWIRWSTICRSIGRKWPHYHLPRSTKRSGDATSDCFVSRRDCRAINTQSKRDSEYFGHAGHTSLCRFGYQPGQSGASHRYHT